MDNNYNITSLLDMNGGAFKERVDYDMARVVENILDINTSPTAKRKITLTIELKPNEDRSKIQVITSSKAFLAPTDAVSTSLALVGDSNGEMQLVEMVPQVPGQVNFAGTEAPAPHVLKMAEIAAKRAAK